MYSFNRKTLIANVFLGDNEAVSYQETVTKKFLQHKHESDDLFVKRVCQYVIGKRKYKGAYTLMNEPEWARLGRQYFADKKGNVVGMLVFTIKDGW